MVSTSRFQVIFVFCLLFLTTSCQGDGLKNVISYGRHNGLQVHTRLDNIIKNVGERGYTAMAAILHASRSKLSGELSSYLTNDPHRTFTIFCPTDQILYSLNYPQKTPLLLDYHITPVRLEKQGFFTLPIGTRISTLFEHSDVVITTLPSSHNASVNGVSIIEWDVYDDEVIAVHGIEKVFNPADAQLIHYITDSYTTDTAPAPDVQSSITTQSKTSTHRSDRSASELLLTLLGYAVVLFGIFHECTRTW